MALGNAIMTDTDGNIGTTVSVSTEKVCGLLFDTSAQATLWTKGPGVQLATKLKDKVIELNSMADVTALGLAAILVQGTPKALAWISWLVFLIITSTNSLLSLVALDVYSSCLQIALQTGMPS